MKTELITQLKQECQCSDNCVSANDPCIPMRAACEIAHLMARIEQDRCAFQELMDKNETLHRLSIALQSDIDHLRDSVVEYVMAISDSKCTSAMESDALELLKQAARGE